MSNLQLESPLHLKQEELAKCSQAHGAEFSVREVVAREFTNLRLKSDDIAAMAAVKKHLGLDLPTEANTVVENDRYVAWWFGPDEWMVVSKSEVTIPEMARQLQTDLGESFARALDVSSGFTLLTLSGSEVEHVINRGCPLDLHESVMPPGRCAQSHFFQASIAVRRTDSLNWEIIVRRSFAIYFADLLIDSAQGI